MVWYVGGNPNIAKGIQNLDAELARGSDRAVGILAGSIVETLLTSFLEAAVEHKSDMWKRLTHSSAPLGSFSVKIDLAFMFRLISDQAHTDLVQIKDIRNRFAHDLDTENFETQSIRDKCKNLKMVESYVVGSDALSSMEVTHLAGKSSFRIGSKTALEELNQPRLRYVWSARVFAMAFGRRFWHPLEGEIAI